VADERETDLVTAASTINIGLLRRALERCLDECERQHLLGPLTRLASLTV